MLTLTVTLLSGEIHRYPARSVSGFHRPLNGEAASLTVTADRAEPMRSPLIRCAGIPGWRMNRG